MRCQYCGREAQPGQVFCECGHPVSLSRGSDPNAVSNGFPTPPSDYDKQWFTPDGRSLASLEKKPGLSAGGKIVLILLVLAIVGVGGFLAYKFIMGQDLLKESNWETVDKSTFSIKIPSAMKENDNIVEIDKGYDKLGFFKADKAGVYIAKAEHTAQSKAAIDQYGIQKMKELTIQVAKTRTINGKKLDVKEHGDLLVAEYDITKANFVKGTDKLWVLDATLITEKRLYEIQAFCAESEKDKYIDAMYKWVESFKAK